MTSLFDSRFVFPKAANKIFTEVFPTVDDFIADYKNSALYGYITDDSAKTLYYLLYARHGNDGILSDDEDQFKYKIWATIMTAGGAWERRLSIQKELRGLTDAELLDGSIQIYNHAVNPSTAPSTLTDQILNYINDQNVTKNKRGKMDALAVLDQILKTDVTSDFLARFDELFSKFPANPSTIYFTEE